MTETPLDREQIRRDANYWINQTQLGPGTPGNHLALYCLALLTELEHSTEALKAIAEVAFIANEGDPWYCEHEGIDTERAYRLYREATATEAT